MSNFAAAETPWLERQALLRNTVRQEVIARQLASIVPPDSRVLDVGCGQGTQALRLARLGHHVVGADPSARLIEAFRRSLTAQDARIRDRIEIRKGSVEDLARVVGSERFDVVCCHGLLMYLADPAAAISSLLSATRPNGLLSLTARNGSALAMRPALRGEWPEALAAFDASSYTNELGVAARAHTLSELSTLIECAGGAVETWYGVRVLTDAVASEAYVPADAATLRSLLDAEDRAGRTDPYRGLGAQLHIVARRL